MANYCGIDNDAPATKALGDDQIEDLVEDFLMEKSPQRTSDGIDYDQEEEESCKPMAISTISEALHWTSELKKFAAEKGFYSVLSDIMSAEDKLHLFSNQQSNNKLSWMHTLGLHSVPDFLCIVTYYACSSFVSVQCASVHCMNLFIDFLAVPILFNNMLILLLFGFRNAEFPVKKGCFVLHVIGNNSGLEKMFDLKRIPDY